MKRHLEFTLCSLLAAASAQQLVAENTGASGSAGGGPPPGPRGAPIAMEQIGAVAGKQYSGDGLDVAATPEGARLRCVFQKLEGEVTREGLWLTSTVTNTMTERFRLKAVAVGRQPSSIRSDRCIVATPKGGQAPLGAAWPIETLTPRDVPLLTELETGLGLLDYNHAAPDGATTSLMPGAQTLSPTGTLSVSDNRVRFIRLGLTEEYSVSMDGVRQDFVIERPPLNSQPSTRNPRAGQLRVELDLAGARAEPLANGARLVLDGSRRKIAYSRLRATDATGKELTARIEVGPARRAGRGEEPLRKGGDGAPGGRALPVALAVVVDDADAVYPVRIDPTFSDANWIGMGGLPGADGPVNAAVLDDAGNLYIGGQFTVVGNVIANSVAKWDGSSWSALGSGVGGDYPYVYALAVSGSDLYAGGWFTTAGGSEANHVAKWDGSTWSALGSGMNSNVYALAVSGTNLYVGGAFTRAGGVLAKYIAKWNGTSWSGVGPGMVTGRYTSVYALAVLGTNLYAGGSFTGAGTITANYIAKWNGSSWSALGSGMDGSVQALAVSGTNLYVGGAFRMAGGSAAAYVAKWNGSSWSALGSGMQGDPMGASVYALAVLGTNLYAGGSFTGAGNITANHIAKWDGSSWSALGSGVGGGTYGTYVFALAMSGSDLYAGGDFTTAGGKVSAYVARAIIGTAGGRFSSPAYSAGTEFSCTFTEATPGEPYRIQTSPSLAVGSWTDLTNFTYTGPIAVTDSSAPGPTNRFYRAVWGP